MQVRVKNDSVEIEGYVNAVERDSKTLFDRIGQFVERICKGAFRRAIKRNDDIHVLLNHDWNRDLGSTKKGNLELEEDNIGLKARVVTADPELVAKGKNGDLVGWSFGFYDMDVERSLENGITHRYVKDLDLREVSILDNSKTPAYDGTLITARSDEKPMLIGEGIIEERAEEPEKINLPEAEEPTEEVENTEKVEEAEGETKEESEEGPKQQDVVKDIDYSKFEEMIKEMKED